MTVINKMFLVESSLMRLSAMLVATTVIIKTLSSLRSKLLSQQSTTESRRRSLRDQKFAITLVVFSIMYVLFQYPVILTYFFMPDMMDFCLYYSSANVMLNLNFSIPFCVYLATNSLFRRECQALSESHRISFGKKPV